MFLIFVVIAFVCLSARFFPLAAEIDWCFKKILALTFFAFAILSLFAYVVIDSLIFLLLPLAFILVSIDTLSTKTNAEPINR